MARLLFLMLVAVIALPVHAEESKNFRIGGDVFQAGKDITLNSESDDVFLAGNRVTIASDIDGSAHVAGRKLALDGAIAGNLYAAGEVVDLRGTVDGNASLLGRAVSVANVEGNLRVGGSEIDLNGDIGGYAMIGAEEVEFNAKVEGDVSLATHEIEWGDAAAITGNLILYEEEPGTLEVPSHILPLDRIERREIEDWEGPKAPTWRGMLANFLVSVVFIAGLAALIAALVPERLAELRRQVLARPIHTLWLGFITLSAVIGSGILFALTIIGLLLTPAMIVLAVVLAIIGYVIAAYSFGVGLMLAVGRDEPDELWDRIIAAAVGALIAGVIGLIPFFGWLFVLALVLAGVGAIAVKVIRPAFFDGPV